jgi:hypothetical protein
MRSNIQNIITICGNSYGIGTKLGFTKVGYQVDTELLVKIEPKTPGALTLVAA